VNVDFFRRNLPNTHVDTINTEVYLNISNLRVTMHYLNTVHYRKNVFSRRNWGWYFRKYFIPITIKFLNINHSKGLLQFPSVFFSVRGARAHNSKMWSDIVDPVVLRGQEHKTINICSLIWNSFRATKPYYFPEESNCSAIALEYLEFSSVLANNTGDFRRLAPQMGS
jgi:hypothetical protein